MSKTSNTSYRDKEGYEGEGDYMLDNNFTLEAVEANENGTTREKIIKYKDDVLETKVSPRKFTLLSVFKLCKFI